MRVSSKVTCFRMEVFPCFPGLSHCDNSRGLASNMGESSLDVSTSNLFGAGYRISESSSLFLIGRQNSGGFLDNASTFAFTLPSLYIISNSKSDNFNFYFQILEVGSLIECIHTKGLRSVMIVNFLPYRYGRKCIALYKIAKHSFSIVE